MKRSLILIVGLLLCGLVITPAYAELTGSASAHVTMTVAPNITVVPSTPQINAGTIQNAPFIAQRIWTVHANMQEITCPWWHLSSLYKGDDPTNPEWNTPDGVKTTVPASFTCPNANRVASSNSLALEWWRRFHRQFPFNKNRGSGLGKQHARSPQPGLYFDRYV